MSLPATGVQGGDNNAGDRRDAGLLGSAGTGQACPGESLDLRRSIRALLVAGNDRPGGRSRLGPGQLTVGDAHLPSTKYGCSPVEDSPRSGEHLHLGRTS